MNATSTQAPSTSPVTPPSRRTQRSTSAPAASGQHDGTTAQQHQGGAARHVPDDRPGRLAGQRQPPAHHVGGRHRGDREQHRHQRPARDTLPATTLPSPSPRAAGTPREHSQRQRQPAGHQGQDHRCRSAAAVEHRRQRRHLEQQREHHGRPPRTVRRRPGASPPARRRRGLPEPSPSAVSASPSRCMPRVSTASSATASVAASSGESPRQQPQQRHQRQPPAASRPSGASTIARPPVRRSTTARRAHREHGQRAESQPERVLTAGPPGRPRTTGRPRSPPRPGR